MRPNNAARAAFTLIELLAATAISAVLLIAVNTVLRNAMGLRDRVHEAQEASDLWNQAAAEIGRDLAHAVAGGPPAGPMYGEPMGSAGKNAARLTFYSAGAAPSVDPPMGDTQKIQYSLIDAALFGLPGGRVLVRAVWRNPLIDPEGEPEYRPLMTGVSALSFEYYAGGAWENEWDSDLIEEGEPPLPEAVRVNAVLAAADGEAGTPRRSGEDGGAVMTLVIPLVHETFPYELQTEAEAGGGTETPGGADESPDEGGNRPPGGGEDGGGGGPFPGGGTGGTPDGGQRS